MGPVHGFVDPTSTDGCHPCPAFSTSRGAVGAPEGESARVHCTSVPSQSDRRRSTSRWPSSPAGGGPAIAQKTVHHFEDYNWDTTRGSELRRRAARRLRACGTPRQSPGHPRYVGNVARWAAG